MEDIDLEEKVNDLISNNFVNNVEEKKRQMNLAMESVRNIIELCGDDPDRDGLIDTPYRFIKAFLEYT